MPPVCTLCRHPERVEIDRALVANQGGSLRDMARRWGVSKDAVARHRAHIPATLAKAQAALEVAAADSLLGQVRHLQAKALGILQAAEAAGDLKVALWAIREARETLELLGKVTRELGDRPQDRGATLEELVAGSYDGDGGR